MPVDPVLEELRRAGLIRPGRRVVVMYSGGRDSTCLLHACARVAGAPAVIALHVNYGLRDAAVEDERHCRRVCEQLGVELLCRVPQRPARGNVQAWARAERYAAAAQIARERSADVASGHTADDQVETILYRTISSPSRRAVLGMRRRERMLEGSGMLLRPLLALTRADTTAYCTRYELSWREDESNESDAYTRNRIRREVLPVLRELHPAAEANLLALASRLRDEADVLDELVERTLAGEAGIELARLRKLPPALARLVVQRLADEACGGVAAGAGARADELAALDERGTAMLDLGAGLRAISEYGRLRIEPLRPPAAAPGAVRLPIPGEAGFGATVIRCELVAPQRSDGVLDLETLAGELTVRGWRPGDRMRPLGLHGSKSLQDLFTARRVPRARRATVAVVESAGEIAWVDGVATSELFKVTAETRRCVRLSAAPR